MQKNKKIVTKIVVLGIIFLLSNANLISQECSVPQRTTPKKKKAAAQVSAQASAYDRGAASAEAHYSPAQPELYTKEEIDDLPHVPGIARAVSTQRELEKTDIIFPEIFNNTGSDLTISWINPVNKTATAHYCKGLRGTIKLPQTQRYGDFMIFALIVKIPEQDFGDRPIDPQLLGVYQIQMQSGLLPRQLKFPLHQILTPSNPNQRVMRDVQLMQEDRQNIPARLTKWRLEEVFVAQAVTPRADGAGPAREPAPKTPLKTNSLASAQSYSQEKSISLESEPSKVALIIAKGSTLLKDFAGATPGAIAGATSSVASVAASAYSSAATTVGSAFSSAKSWISSGAAAAGPDTQESPPPLAQAITGDSHSQAETPAPSAAATKKYQVPPPPPPPPPAITIAQKSLSKAIISRRSEKSPYSGAAAAADIPELSLAQQIAQTHLKRTADRKPSSSKKTTKESTEATGASAADSDMLRAIAREMAARKKKTDKTIHSDPHKPKTTIAPSAPPAPALIANQTSKVPVHAPPPPPPPPPAITIAQKSQPKAIISRRSEKSPNSGAAAAADMPELSLAQQIAQTHLKRAADRKTSSSKKTTKGSTEAAGASGSSSDMLGAIAREMAARRKAVGKTARSDSDNSDNDEWQ